MKMKTLIASFGALMIIGLLVMTGCQSPFDLPSAPATGRTGTLIVSVNGDNGRTILPRAQLDRYTLELFVWDEDADGGAAYVAYENDYPTEARGATAFVLPAGKYKILVEGQIITGTLSAEDGGDPIYETIAEGEETDIEVLINKAASINIELEPYATGDGTFSWDFDVDGVTDVAIEIYKSAEYDADPDTAVDLLADEDDISFEKDSFDLAAGVYNVKFTVTALGKEYNWWEILYIYAGLTSVYGNADLVAREVLPTIPYVVPTIPTGDAGYFFLDLNDWKTPTTSDGGRVSTPVTGKTTAENLTVTFTIENQLLNIKLTPAQVALMADASHIAVTIKGSATPDTAFRFFLGAAGAGGEWNGTADAHQGAFSTIVSGPKMTAFGGNKNDTSNGHCRYEYLLLQQRAAATTTVTIESVRIDYYTMDAGSNGVLFLDLKNSAASDGSTVAGTVTNGNLTASFTEDQQRLSIGLTEAQANLFKGTASPLIESVWATITGTADPNTTTFRYFLGDASLSSGWNATDNGQEGAISGILGTKSGDLGLNTGRNGIKALVLQQREGTTTALRINSIWLEYKNKVIPPAIPATADFVVFQSTAMGGTDAPIINGVAISKNWDDLLVGGEGEDKDDHALDRIVTFPLQSGDQLDIRSYEKFSIKVKYYLNDGNGAKGAELTLTNGKQWGQVTISGVNHYNLGEDGSGGTVNVTIAGATYAALAGDTSLTLNFQGRDNWSNVTDGTNTGALGFIELHEIIFYASTAEPPETLPSAGTALANLNDYDGIQTAGASGQPSYTQLTAGGLLITNRGADWHSVELQVFEPVLEFLDPNGDPDDPDDQQDPESDWVITNPSWQVLVEKTSTYRLTVTGRVVFVAGAVAEIVKSGPDYSNYASSPVTGEAGKVVTFTVSTETLTGDMLLANNATTNPNGNPPRLRVNATGHPDFIIDSIELIEWDPTSNAGAGGVLQVEDPDNAGEFIDVEATIDLKFGNT
jgi:hypothetical protein